MSYALLGLISDLLFQLLGNPYLISITLLAFFIILLLAARINNPIIILAVIAPVIIGFILNDDANGIFHLDAWSGYWILMVMGVFMAIFLTYLFSRN